MYYSSRFYVAVCLFSNTSQPAEEALMFAYLRRRGKREAQVACKGKSTLACDSVPDLLLNRRKAGFCPGVPVHKGITIVLSLFRSHWLAVVY